MARRCSGTELCREAEIVVIGAGRSSMWRRSATHKRWTRGGRNVYDSDTCSWATSRNVKKMIFGAMESPGRQIVDMSKAVIRDRQQRVEAV